VHEALKVRRKARPMAPMNDLALELPADDPDPEVTYLRSLYVREFRLALSRAMQALARRERLLLRQHYLDKMSLEAVAKAYRVHRATAARWIADARSAVLDKTKSELAEGLHLRPSELNSVLSFVQKQSSFGAHLSEIRRTLG
jgi:RNA polymerase sigma-70 factor (ECF subfamily)